MLASKHTPLAPVVLYPAGPPGPGEWKVVRAGDNLRLMQEAPTQLLRRRSPWIAALCLSLALALLSGCAGRARPRQPQSTPTRPVGVYHVVERGQTLWRIAQVYEVPLEQLVEANKIDEPERIEIGSRLWIPGAHERRPVPLTVAGGDGARFLWPVPGGRIISLSK
jgi:nucleoid-associated protein YgaU